VAKRVFTSFAIEDSNLRDFLRGQARNEHSPFEFTDMSVKQPWDSSWKTQCRSRIKGCDGVIGIITKNTPYAAGQLWELQCAYEENVSVLLIHGDGSAPANLPAPITNRRVLNWSWDNIGNFLARL